MEEPWDELMGPSPEALKKMLRKEEEELGLQRKPSRTRSSSSSKKPPVRRAPSAPPPPTMFSKLPDRWAQHEMEQQVTSSRTSSKAASSRSSMRSGLRASASAVAPPSVTITPQPTAPMTPKKLSLAFEDEGMESEGVETEGIEVPVNMHQDAISIRQEALKVLEVADDQLADSSYAVHRTVTGGYMASARSLGDKKRVRSALSGLNFKGKRPSAKYSNLPDGDDPYSAGETTTREDYEYGDTGVVDVAGMERRSMSSRPAKEETSRSGSKNWSSRYSVDKTLLSLSGGSVSSGKLLDKMDRQHDDQERRTFRNLFASSPHTKDTEVFGSGFSFRKNHVFGKQKTTIKKPETNLQTVWMDTEGSSSLPPANHRSKSWQDQLQQKRNQRRRYIIVVLAAFVLAVTLGSVLGTKKNRVASSNVSDNVDVAAPIAPGSVTFYVTADAPYDLAAEDRLVQDLKSLSPQASMLIHLGNLQEAAVTLCQPSRYGNLASLLKQSPVPTFVLPGPEDWNNCPNPDEAWDSWERRFGNFHRNFEHTFEVMHEAEEFENFAILNQGVLFLGLHIVGGRVWDAEEWAERNEYNYEWVEGMANTHADDVRAMVLLANARPGEPQNRELFSRLAEFFSGYDKPVAYVHANSGLTGGTQVYSPFEGEDNVMAIQVGNNGDNPPLRLNVGFGDRPFVLG